MPTDYKYLPYQKSSTISFETVYAQQMMKGICRAERL